MTDSVIIRSFRESDLGLVYHTWPKGVYYGAAEPIEQSKNDWFSSFYEYMTLLLPHCQIWVACLKSDPDCMMGYAIFHGPILEWVFVKKDYRKHGIARMLLGSQVKTVNFHHLTKIGKELLPQLKLGETV